MATNAALASDGLRMAIWIFIAFWLWLGLEVLLRKLRLPLAFAIAAALSWIGAELSLRWVLPVVGELMALHLRVPRGFLSML
jgi:hypothetical protein